jgi:chemotaxis protein CheD
MPGKSPHKVVYVAQSDLHATKDPNIVISAVLGSCIATCLYDERNQIGGMNHLLLPEKGANDKSADRFGVNLMELLVNEMFKLGGNRKYFVAKIFGGANVSLGGSTIGARNIAFVKDFLAGERIPCVAESVGGNRARRIRFTPTTGRISQLILDPTDTRTELATMAPPAPAPETTSEPEVWG